MPPPPPISHTPLFDHSTTTQVRIADHRPRLVGTWRTESRGRPHTQDVRRGLFRLGLKATLSDVLSYCVPEPWCRFLHSFSLELQSRLTTRTPPCIMLPRFIVQCALSPIPASPMVTLQGLHSCVRRNDCLPPRFPDARALLLPQLAQHRSLRRPLLRVCLVLSL